MDSSAAHENGIVQFLDQIGRRRFAALLELGPKRRNKLRELLDHRIILDARFAKEIIGADQNPEKVTSRLRAMGSPSFCWVISADLNLDQREMSLVEAVGSMFDSMSGGFVSCLPGRLAYFQPEPPGARYILNM